MNLKLLGMLGIVLLLALPILSCSPKENSTGEGLPAIEQTAEPKEGEVFYKGYRVDKEVLGSDDWVAGSHIVLVEPLILKDNDFAEDVSYSDLLLFLAETRSQRDFINSFDTYGHPIGNLYTCGYYVEQLHNSAEEQGIRASVAILESSELHGINAFNTTDKGIVYVDASYYDDKIFYELSIGQTYYVYGNPVVVRNYQIIWEGYKTPESE